MGDLFETGRWVIFAGLIGLAVLSILPTPVHDQQWTLAGTTLTIDTPCAKSVNILTGPAGGAVGITGRGHRSELDGLKLTGGAAARIAGTGCHSNFFSNTTLVLTVTVPVGTAITIDETGDTDYNIAAVNGPLSLQLSGGGDVQVAAATNVVANSTSDGDITIDAVNGTLEGTLQGSGDLRIGTINAPTTNLLLSGSGDAHLGAGNAGLVSATLSADGDLHAPAVAGLKLNMNGNGDVTAGADAGSLQATLSGNGDLKIGSVAGDAVVNASGANDVTIRRVAGHLTQSNTGSGDMKIGGT